MQLPGPRIADPAIRSQRGIPKMTRPIRKKKKGSIERSESFDEFLAKEGLLAETEDAAIKEILADQSIPRRQDLKQMRKENSEVLLTLALKPDDH